MWLSGRSVPAQWALKGSQSQIPACMRSPCLSPSLPSCWQRNLRFLSLWVALSLGPLLASPGRQFHLGQSPWTLPGTKEALCKGVSNKVLQKVQGVGWAPSLVSMSLGRLEWPAWGGGGGEERGWNWLHVSPVSHALEKLLRGGASIYLLPHFQDVSFVLTLKYVSLVLVSGLKELLLLLACLFSMSF